MTVSWYRPGPLARLWRQLSRAPLTAARWGEGVGRRPSEAVDLAWLVQWWARS